jgi:hypothetical protein
MSVILALGRLRQKNLQFKASLELSLGQTRMWKKDRCLYTRK